MTTKYSEDHEWISVDGDIGTVGITEHAQEQLGELVFVELPEVGKSVAKGDETAVIESVKAASEIYAPVSGEVTEVNGALEESPTRINDDAEGEGWIFRMRIADAGELEELMDADGYKAFAADA